MLSFIEVLAVIVALYVISSNIIIYTPRHINLISIHILSLQISRFPTLQLIFYIHSFRLWPNIYY